MYCMCPHKGHYLFSSQVIIIINTVWRKKTNKTNMGLRIGASGFIVRITVNVARKAHKNNYSSVSAY